MNLGAYFFSVCSNDFYNYNNDWYGPHKQTSEALDYKAQLSCKAYTLNTGDFFRASNKQWETKGSYYAIITRVIFVALLLDTLVSFLSVR